MGTSGGKRTFAFTVYLPRLARLFVIPFALPSLFNPIFLQHLHDVRGRVGCVVTVRNRDVYARRNPTIKIHPVSIHRCVRITAVCAYKQPYWQCCCCCCGPYYSCVFVASNLGRITAKIAIREIRLYRGSAPIYGIPLLFCLRRAQLLLDQPLFPARGPLFHFPLISSDIIRS